MDRYEWLSRLWQLAQIPTHSPSSLKELQGLVRTAIIRTIVNTDYPYNDLCQYCVKHGKCDHAYATYIYCEANGNFEME